MIIFLTFSFTISKVELMIKSKTKEGKYDKIYFPNKASIARYGVVWNYAVIYAPILDIKSTKGSLEFCKIGEKTFFPQLY